MEKFKWEPIYDSENGEWYAQKMVYMNPPDVEGPFETEDAASAKCDQLNGHICGLECERRCCEIEGHEFEHGICEHCYAEDPNFDQIAEQEEMDDSEGEARFELRDER